MAINTAKLGQIVQDFVAKTADVQGAAMVTPSFFFARWYG